MHPELPGEPAFPWLDRLAALWPERVAVTNPDCELHYSYVDLRNRTIAVHHFLLEQGVGPGDRVASLMHNGVLHLDLLFACGRLGAVYAPLNWRLSRRELQVLLDDLEPRLVVVDRELGGTVDPGCSVEFGDSLPFTVTHPEPDAAAVATSDPWLILYTGGTTGAPKGAVLTHGSMLWNCINTTMSWGLSQADVGPSLTPMFHTGGFNVFTLPLLLLGGRVLLPTRFDPAATIALLESERPTVLFMVPTMFQLVADQPGFATVDCSSVRWAISGGAPLPEPVYRAWRDKVAVFKQGYGLTEVGPNNFATPDCDAATKAGTVGRLTYFTRARIVDDRGNDLETGQSGELLLAGPHMCAGYWRRPDATAEVIQNGWFHTGDVARRDDDGYYYIVDRKKDMIITGGENVYPAEVEVVLYEHPAVRQAAVVGVPDPVWGELVTGVVSLRPGTAASEDELRAFANQSLARYKVPKRIVVVDEIPSSAAGKILRSVARELALRQDVP